MKTYVILAMVFAVCLSGLFFAVKGYGAAKYREGRLAAINAQQATDLAHAAVVMEKRNQHYEQALGWVNQLNGIQDDSVTGPKLGLVFDRLQPNPPARKPSK